MKILVIHSKYRQLGGEDIVVNQEISLLKNYYDVDSLVFQNLSGIKGFFQFLSSLWNFRVYRIVKKEINRFKPDIVFVHNWHYATGPIVFRAVKSMNIPVVHTLHNYRLICPSATLMHKDKLFDASLNSQFPWKAIFKKVYRNSYAQTFYLAFIVWVHKKIGTWNLIDKFICLTRNGVDLFVNAKLGFQKEQFVVKPNFIFPVQHNFTLPRADHFLYVGRLSSEKGIELLIKAFEGTEYKLSIAGDGPLKEKIISAAAQNPNINYIGKLNSSQLIEEYKKAKALIFPSIWYEPFGMTIIEAYACALPVIASGIGASLELVKHGKTGLIFTSGNRQALRKALDEMSGYSQPQYQELQRQAEAYFYSDFSPKSQEEYFKKVFSSLLYDKKKDTIGLNSQP